MKALKFQFLSLIAAVLITGCSNDDDPGQGNNERKDITLSRGGEEIVNANNEFAFRLMDELNNDAENVVISPLSMYQYLSMVANGADGDTKKEIEAVLGAGELSIDDINAINYDLVSSLKAADKKTTFTLSNSLWHSKDIDILPGYAVALKDYYASETYVLDSLNSDYARKEINKWCEKNTSGVIKDFLKENLQDNTKYVSYNATYFKSEWSKHFKLDSNDKFYNSDGSVSMVSYMKSSAACWGYENNDFQYIEIPYGNGAFMFSIVMLKENGVFSVADANAGLDKNYRDLVKITMPKFKVDFIKSMGDVLLNMGINKAFSEESEFTKASSYCQPLPQILHATSVEIDEKGTVAASVSGSGLYTSPMPTSIIIDRPFMFFIKETSTSTILFIGKVNKL